MTAGRLQLKLVRPEQGRGVFFPPLWGENRILKIIFPPLSGPLGGKNGMFFPPLFGPLGGKTFLFSPHKGGKKLAAGENFEDFHFRDARNPVQKRISEG